MPVINMIVDCRDHSKDEDITIDTSSADVGFFEGTLTYLEIPKSSDFDLIESYTFADFLELEEVFVPKNVANIQKNAFLNCPKLKKIVLGRKANKALQKNQPWGAPADCVVTYDPKAKPRAT
ncbi:leucine-rich repeat protein [Selenomonas ruminantium]|uniref:Leucine rich repeat-containing protein n=1 Tax=Selenomonas ruminantium TaxID=971 RepID=A0A1I0YBM9_SELRU|nr:leucine-rich repeat protein [Selenomonas ruminantium]SFB10805.1 Leucine rich repeat-containing protein [Selenomonas ruminantium]